MGIIRLAVASALAMGAAAARAAEGPVVVELFTSQGCYSCPTVEAYLRDLAARSDLVALEWHVDYWNELVYGAAGKWRDPFSAPEYTQRQVIYGRSLGGRVYTPQMVVDGRLEAVGSDRTAVEQALVRSAPDSAAKVPLTAAGENKGKGLHSRNVVTGLRRIGAWSGQPLQVSVPDLELREDEGCAVLLQGNAQGPILVAHYCPVVGPS